MSAGVQMPTLLLIEDDAELRELLARQAEYAGYAVLQAGSGEQALALCARGRAIDVVLSDVDLPGMDGHAIAEVLGEHYPVILMSGRFRRTRTGRLAKPFTSAQLVEALHQAHRLRCAS